MRGHSGGRSSDPWIASRSSCFSLYSNEGENLRNSTRKLRRWSRVPPLPHCSPYELRWLSIFSWSFNPRNLPVGEQYFQRSCPLDCDQLSCWSGLCPPALSWLWLCLIFPLVWTWSIYLVALMFESQVSLVDYTLDLCHWHCFQDHLEQDTCSSFNPFELPFLIPVLVLAPLWRMGKGSQTTAAEIKVNEVPCCSDSLCFILKRPYKQQDK